MSLYATLIIFFADPSIDLGDSPLDDRGRLLSPEHLLNHSHSHKFDMPMCFHVLPCVLVKRGDSPGDADATSRLICNFGNVEYACPFHGECSFG